MTQLTLDVEGMYASRAIKREVLFDAKGTEREHIVVVLNILTEFYGH